RTPLSAFIHACRRTHHDAEDGLQTVSVAIMEEAGQGVEPVAFMPWAREIAWRRVLAYRRGSARQRPLDPAVVRCLAEAAGRVDEARPGPLLREALLRCLSR